MFTVVTSGKKIGRILVVILLSSILLVTVLFTVSGEGTDDSLYASGKDALSRQEFLVGLGYTLDSSFPEEKKAVVIPFEFSDVYENYNNLQKSAGFDLEAFAGKNVNQYTVKLIADGRDDVYAHLLVYEDKIIGGDITALSVDDGYMLPLENKVEKQE